MERKMIYLLITVVALLSGCTQATATTLPAPIPTGVLTPYHTTTPTTNQPTSTFVVTIPVTPAPTPTPFLHTITNDDTMLGIAYQYGISLEELQAANPGVDPHFLSVGKQLIIPISGEIAAILPTLTPVPVRWEQPRCFRTGEGGVTCIMEVHNDLEYDVENLSAWIGLYTTQGENIANQTVYTPMNLLSPGSTTPLMAYFEPPIPAQVEARAELISGISVGEDDNRYINAQVETESTIISADGRRATVQGKVNLPDESLMPAQLWVLVVAYDQGGNIIGSRRWESSGEILFNVTVYALEGTIDKVEFLTEARQ